MKGHGRGYKTIRFNRFNRRFRIQLYYPAMYLKKNDILFRFVVVFRVCWSEYKSFGLAFAVGFGLGFDYVPDTEGG